jgi:biotin carboxyl carrier protein
MSAVLSDDSGPAARGSKSDARAGLDGAWTGLAGATDSATLCMHWLTLQCAAIDDVRTGLLLLRNDAGDAYVPAAVWPDGGADLAYLAAAAQEALTRRNGVVESVPAGEGRPEAIHVAYPVETDGETIGVVALDIAPRIESQVRAALRQLIWGGAWLDALALRRRAMLQSESASRAARALDMLAMVEEHDRLQPAAMALVNEMVTRGLADRAGLGLLLGKQLEVVAVSRSAAFERKSQLAVAMANAMDEALDQRASVCEPPTPATAGRIAVAQRDLAARAGHANVCAIPLVIRDRALGALLLERTQVPFTDAEIAGFEVIAGLVARPFDTRLTLDRWVAGRAADILADWRDRLFGPRHPVAKLTGLGALLLALFLVIAEGEFRVSAKTVVEGAIQRAAVAPFEGFIMEAPVRAGDLVRAGQLLARLDDRDLRLDRVKFASEREQQLRKYHDALAKHDRSQAGILMAQAAQSEAQIALVDEKLARTRVSAPYDGVVVSGDLSQLLGSPVEQGKLLFEIAPLDSFRVILKVDDRDIAYVLGGQHGWLALSGMGGDPMRFEVTKVTSVSTAQEGHNYFRVEAHLEKPRAGIRPGMEGVGKIVVDRRKLAWIWTRGLIDWLRITLWTWLP